MVQPRLTILQQLGDELLKQPLQKANNITLLLKSTAHTSSQDEVLVSIKQLQLFFLASLEREELVLSSKVEAKMAAPEEQHAAWLRTQYSSYLGKLQQLLISSPHPPVQVAAFVAGMEAARASSTRFHFNNHIFDSLLQAWLRNKHPSPEVSARLASKYLPHADVRFYLLRTIAAMAECMQSGSSSKGGPLPVASQNKKPQRSAVAMKLLDFLLQVGTPFPAGEMTSWCGAIEAGQTAMETKVPPAKKRRLDAEPGIKKAALEGAKWAKLSQQKRAFTDAWLAVLRLPLPLPDLRRALAHLPDSVIPYLAQPLLLSDFLTCSVDAGGLTGMLALHGIFILVTQHGLEYPHFFRRLYALLTPDIFTARHRARFLTLADIFLSSGLVPAYTAAAFAKRFARLSLTAPPAGAITCTGFVHNLLRRHPACQILLHRPSAGAGAKPATAPPAKPPGQADATDPGLTANGSPPAAAAAVPAGHDPYDESEPDPARSQALGSSLWEVESLRDHYCPQVAASVSLLDRDFSDPRKTLEISVSQYAAGSYAAIIKQELDTRLKKAPIAFHAQPVTALFSTTSAIAGFTF
ncbi:hypothetical protein WJX84_003568 [Apatococcus fuscideae]|uniref:CCAAT-binding factor domain-containing protein n=1 Tax=Apatococcus fuscideae TaxID=2026836 RepID=A0AAW1SXS9_9CHLO